MALITALEVVNQGTFKGAPINQRFDASLISPHIHIAEARHLKAIFCTAFYDALVAAKDGVGQYNLDLGATSIAFSTNANYETLYKEYILPYMSICILDQALPTISIQIGSAGVFQNNPEFGQNKGIEGVQYLQQKLQKDITVLKKVMLDYLCANAANYPLFCTTDCPDSECTDSDSETFLSNDLGIIFY